MRAVIQRVSSARVTVAGAVTGEIGPGLLVLVGVARDDTLEDGRWLAEKLVRLRVFDAPETGQMNASVQDVGGGVLVVSQFTLFASTKKGTRPSYSDAARPEQAEPLYEEFVRQVSAALGRPAATGKFAAMMDVALVNDGPVTLLIDTKNRE
jgi:D-tyrosyl-tRNA(Tyr) deacylase